MIKRKLILISIHIKNSPQGIPLAASMLKAQLDSVAEINDKVEVSFIDFYVGTSAEAIADSLSEKSPYMIGFSTYLWNRELTEKICLIIKHRFPEIILFAGGAEATALPENLLKSAPFNFVIKGEGELALTEVIRRLLQNKSYGDVPGVILKDDPDSLLKNQWPVENLDALPSPFLTGILDPEKYSGMLWELSRGCPFRCSFCFESRGVAGVRQFSLERIREELELFELKKVSQIFVLDPTFNRDVKRAKKILRMIEKTAPLIHFTFEVRTEFIDNEMAGLFAKINCSLQIGLQSALPEILSNVNRNIDPEKYAEKISLLNSNGVIFGLDLIYGLPGDTLNGFKHSLNYALGLQPNHLDIFPLAILPGTALYEDAGSFELNYLHETPYTLISSPGFSETDMETAESLKNACSIFYNQGGAAGWMFMITETFNIEPSELLENFAEYISSEKEKDFSADELNLHQRTFVKKQFSKKNKQNLYPVMEDLILFHGALNRSLYTGAFDGKIKVSFNDETVFKLSPGTVFINLRYNFDDLMTVGEFTLEEFLSNYSPEKTYAVIYNCGGVVKPLIVEKKLSLLLQTFNGKDTFKSILKKNSSIDRNDLNEFIEYAVSETIIYHL